MFNYSQDTIPPRSENPRTRTPRTKSLEGYVTFSYMVTEIQLQACCVNSKPKLTAVSS